MVLNDLVAKLKGLSDKQVAEAADAYKAAVKTAGAGKPVDPVRLLPILEAAGKTPNEFRDDAQAVADRLAAKAKAARLPAALAARAAADAKLTKLDEEYAASQAAYVKARGPLAFEADRAYKEVAACQNAASGLASEGFELAPNLAERQRELRQEWGRLKDRESKLTSEGIKHGTALQFATGQQTSGNMRYHDPDKANAARAELNRLNAEQATIDARLAAINSELAALDDEAAKV